MTTGRQREEVSKEDSVKGKNTHSFWRKLHKVSAFATDSHEVRISEIDNRKERTAEAIRCPICKAAHNLDVCRRMLLIG